MKITLIGLGVQQDDLSYKAKKILDSATCIYARSALSAPYQSLKEYSVIYLDELFQRSRNFDTLNKKLAQTILTAAKEQNVVYCVDGAVSEDVACRTIIKKHKDVEICEGVSKASHIASLGGITSGQVTGISAYEIQNLKWCIAACVYDIDDEYMAYLVKERLSELFGEEASCCFIRGTEVKNIMVYELDRQKSYDCSCGVAIQADEFLKRKRYDYADLVHLVTLLRAPNGCPWDRSQTPLTLRKDIIEEAYELVDAIEKDDDAAVREEAGDLLLQSAFVSVLFNEQGAFTSDDVTSEIVSKLIFRHSHVFGSDKVTNSEEALSVWEKNKLIEKEQTTYTQTLEAVPNAFPACMRAQKVQKRAAKSGFDFASVQDAGKRMTEEYAELLAAIATGDKAAIQEEVGDLLFSAINVGRLSGADCEEALRASVQKFCKRFACTEELVLADGKRMEQLSEQELDEYYQKAKDATKTH